MVYQAPREHIVRESRILEYERILDIERQSLREEKVQVNREKIIAKDLMIRLNGIRELLKRESDKLEVKGLELQRQQNESTKWQEQLSKEEKLLEEERETLKADIERLASDKQEFARNEARIFEMHREVLELRTKVVAEREILETDRVGFERLRFNEEMEEKRVALDAIREKLENDRLEFERQKKEMLHKGNETQLEIRKAAKISVSKSAKNKKAVREMKDSKSARISAPKSAKNSRNSFDVQYLSEGTCINTTITIHEKHIQCPMTPNIPFSALNQILSKKQRSFGWRYEGKVFNFMAKDKEQRNQILLSGILTRFPSNKTNLAHWKTIELACMTTEKVNLDIDHEPNTPSAEFR